MEHLRCLHGAECGTIGGGNDCTILSHHLYRILHRDGGGSGLGAVACADHLVNEGRGSKGTGAIVDGDDPRFGLCFQRCGQHRMDAGRATFYYADRLAETRSCAQLGNGLHVVLPCCHDDLADEAGVVDSPQGALQHRDTANKSEELIQAAHSRAAACRSHYHGAEGHSLIPHLLGCCS